MPQPIDHPKRVCPLWFSWFLTNPLRRRFQNPHEILRPHVTAGMSVADVGCGPGFFTVALAELVGPEGKVQAVDLREQQLQTTMLRCEKAGVRDRVIPRQAGPTELNLQGPIDFALAFAVVHEVPDVPALFRQVFAALRPGGKVLVCEPIVHVPADRVERELAIARDQGFTGQMLANAVRISRTFELLRPSGV